MNKQTLILIIFLSLLAILLGFNYFARPFEKLAQNFTNPQVAENFDVVEELSPEEKILSQLTAIEKLAQLIALPVVLNETAVFNLENQIATSSTERLASASAELNSSDVSLWIKSNQPGFVTIFGSNISQSQLQEFASQIETNKPQLKTYLVVDHEGGTVQRLSGKGFSKLPSWQEFCQIDDKNMRLDLLSSSSAELSTAGIDIVLAPVVDVGNNPILKSRICSDDPELVASRAAEYIAVFNKQNILPVLKHFPGIGKTTKDLHKQFDQIVVEATDVLIYKNLLDQFPYLAAMISHVGVKNQYVDIPCSLSQSCVAELSDSYPNTIIFSDALDMKSALYNKDNAELKSIEQASTEAINAGINILVYSPKVETEKFDTILENLLKQYETDVNFKAKVDASVLKIISLKEGSRFAGK